MKWTALIISTISFIGAACFGILAVIGPYLWSQIVSIVLCIGMTSLGTYWALAAADEFYWAKLLKRMRKMP